MALVPQIGAEVWRRRMPATHQETVQEVGEASEADLVLLASHRGKEH